MKKPNKPRKPSIASNLRAQLKTGKQFWMGADSKYQQNLVAEIAKETGASIITDRDDKWRGWDVLRRLRSTCHKAPVMWVDGSYVCCHPKCGKSCKVI